MRVLIADDDKAFAEYLAALVWACDHEVVGVVTGGGLAVLQSYWTHRPDVLLLDVMMPKFNGFTVCQQLLSRDPAACVILMSGLVASDFPRLNSCKARGFIGKPLAFVVSVTFHVLLCPVASAFVADWSTNLKRQRFSARLPCELVEKDGNTAGNFGRPQPW